MATHKTHWVDLRRNALFNHCLRTSDNFRVAEVAMLSYGKPAD